MITICLDFGNTRLKLALFEDDELKEILVLQNDPFSHLEEIIKKYSPHRSILSSVIEHDIKIEELLIDTTQFH